MESLLEKDSSIPVTIVTGFLGSGKTTLLNHILSNQKGLKTAVLVNEFGEIGIDNDLIVKTSEEMIELSNGCICCSINGELLESVKKLIIKSPKIEYIIVETTGLADPLPIAMTFLGSELRDLTRLDSIITLIDADNFSPEIISSEVGRSQIIYGDILILNKCDLATEERLSKIERELEDIKRDPRILRCNNAKVSIPLLISVGLFETDRLNIANSEVTHEHDHSNCDHAHGECEHDHQSHVNKQKNKTRTPESFDIEGFTSISFKSEKPFSLRKFQNFLDNQLSPEVFRAKGILWFNESERKHIFHLAGKRFSIDDSNWEGKRMNKLVLIGKRLNHEQINKQIKACEGMDS